MTRLFSTLVGVLFCSAVFAQTQPDFFTTALGTGSIGNVLSNDTYSGGFAQLVDPHPCFAMLDNG